jgi:hypothetical protein
MKRSQVYRLDDYTCDAGIVRYLEISECVQGREFP